MKTSLIPTALATLVVPVCLAAMSTCAHAQDSHDWVARSDENTELMIELEAGFSPEGASVNGISKYDGLTMDLGPRLVERRIAAAEELIAEYQSRLVGEQDPRVRQDLEILIARLEHDVEGGRLGQEYALAWQNIPEKIFTSAASLLSDQNPPERRAKAAELLQRYTGLYPGTKSATEQAKAMWVESQGEGKIGPYRGAVEDAIGKIPTYAAGIRALFAKQGIAGAEAALDAMDQQFADFADWTRETVLPAARDDFRQPEELYAFALKSVGIDVAPEQLIDRAKVAFFETRLAMQILAPLVAEKYGFDDTDYRAVIRELKKDTIPDDRLVETYSRVIGEIEEMMAEHAIVTVPTYRAKMRRSTPAEAAAQAAPHMRPPPLIDNTGQQGEFILPVAVAGADGSSLSYDDFNFDAAKWTLSAHEARPGHELQFATMLDLGVSRARGLYAFNFVNVEGWALYAEAEMIPYEPVEGQLIALQHRLLRAARAFIDPMLNLGVISTDDARKILSEDVVLSDAMVKQELDRYTFNLPGQAASYFYGYWRLVNLRVSTELALGDKFDRKAFNDFILSLGLLPPDQVAAAVEADFIPQQLAQ